MKISLDKIVCEGNRKYTKDVGFEQLLNSIKQYGILEPPIVRKIQDGRGIEHLYKTIAGRRRIAAARQLGLTEVDCVVRDDPVDDEEIALTENVNRLDMHPLDEAAAFKRMADEGKSIEEIARYFARSPSAIYKRLRLVPLIEELKGWFRDQLLDISGAAVLAELPEEDQKKFYDEHEAQFVELPPEDINETYGIGGQTISQFIYKHQRNKIRKCLGNDCQTCKKRTHNSENDLFEEFADMDDVCLDGDCYRAKWKRVIEGALAESYNLNLPTDAKIIFRSSTLERLYKRATHAELFYADSNTRFEIIKDEDYEITGETKRKTGGCCWLIHEASDGETTAARIGYKERPKEKRAATQSKAESRSGKDKVTQYGRDVLETVAAERETSAAELAEELGKKTSGYNFTSEIGELVYERVVARRIEKEKDGTAPRVDYCSLFLQKAEDDGIGCSNFFEKSFSAQQKKWWSGLYGKESQASVFADIPDEVQPLFHFLLLSIGFENSVPDLDELKGIEKRNNPFWEYAQMDEEEYRALYRQVAKEVVSKILPKPKKTGKAAVPHGGDVPADTSGAGSSSSKRKKGAKKDGDNGDDDPDVDMSEDEDAV